MNDQFALLQPDFLTSVTISVLALIYSLVARRRAKQLRNQTRTLGQAMRRWEEESFTQEQIDWLDKHAGRPSVMDN